MRRRAEQVDHTRQRIIEATVALHGSVGPAATTIVAIADLAKVTRLTVYRHFPDETALFNACSAHWMSQQQPPDPGAWSKIEDPVSRLRVGLTDLYRFYRAGVSMLTCVYRDFEVLPTAHKQALRDQEAIVCQVLAEPFVAIPRRRRRLRALIGHAISFSTWHSLCVDQGLSDRAAIDAMISMILAAVPAPSVQPAGPAPPAEVPASP